MGLNGTAKRSIWILAGALVAHFLSELTRQELFSWIALVLGIWLFLNLYWLFVCSIGYFSKHEALPALEEVEMFGEADHPAHNESNLPMSSALAQSMRHTLSE